MNDLRLLPPRGSPVSPITFRRLLLVGALSLAAAVLFWWPLLTGGALSGNDWSSHHYHYFDYVRSSLRRFATLPLYMPDAVMTPNFLANAESPLLSPLDPLLAGSRHGRLPEAADRALQRGGTRGRLPPVAGSRGSDAGRGASRDHLQPGRLPAGAPGRWTSLVARHAAAAGVAVSLPARGARQQRRPLARGFALRQRDHRRSAPALHLARPASSRASRRCGRRTRVRPSRSCASRGCSQRPLGSRRRSCCRCSRSSRTTRRRSASRAFRSGCSSRRSPRAASSRTSRPLDSHFTYGAGWWEYAFYVGPIALLCIVVGIAVGARRLEPAACSARCSCGSRSSRRCRCSIRGRCCATCPYGARSERRHAFWSSRSSRSAWSRHSGWRGSSSWRRAARGRLAVGVCAGAGAVRRGRSARREPCVATRGAGPADRGAGSPAASDRVRIAGGNPRRARRVQPQSTRLSGPVAGVGAGRLPRALGEVARRMGARRRAREQSLWQTRRRSPARRQPDHDDLSARVSAGGSRRLHGDGDRVFSRSSWSGGGVPSDARFDWLRRPGVWLWLALARRRSAARLPRRVYGGKLRRPDQAQPREDGARDRAARVLRARTERQSSAHGVALLRSRVRARRRDGHPVSRAAASASSRCSMRSQRCPCGRSSAAPPGATPS